MNKLSKIGVAAAVAALPLLSLAQTYNTPAENVLATVQRILNIVVPIVVTLALIYFLWGLAQYILSAGDEEKKTDGKHIMIWGIIALFVMVSVWGLVRFISGTTGVGQDQQINLPYVTH